MIQLNLFHKIITCYHCGADPGAGTNPYLWAGFLDNETKQHVCNKCRKVHYQDKLSKSPTGGIIMQELPVIILVA